MTDAKRRAERALARTDQEQREAIASREATVKNLQWSGKLTKAERQVLYHATKAYGLDPALREVLVLGGNLYCTVSGMVRVAERSGDYAGLRYEELESREEGEIRYRCTVRKMVEGRGGSRQSCEFEGLGRAVASKLNKVTKDFADEMAQTRALGRALRRAWPISMPAFDELNPAERAGATVVPPHLLAEVVEEMETDSGAPENAPAAGGEMSEEAYVQQGPPDRGPGEEG
jgi:hypothetical protein